MAYGTVKVDNITFDNGGSDQNVTVSGLYRATTSGVTVSGTIVAATVSGVTIIGSTTVSGATVTGTTANFTSGNFSNIISSAATMSGALIMANQQQVRFREAVGNGVNHIALQAPAIVSADQTITLPDQTGTVVTTGDNGSVTSTMILDGTILNADINASAAIAGTKISPDFGSQTIVTTGVHSAAAGSATTPSIAFTGDLNTGIYSPGADQLAVSTGGTGRLFVDASGSVGIGTSAPSQLLHCAGIARIGADNTSTAELEIGAGATGNRYAVIDLIGDTTYTDYGLRIIRENSGANTNSAIQHRGTGALSIAVADAGVISLATSNTERARIDSSGRLLVGTSSVKSSADIKQEIVNGGLSLSSYIDNQFSYSLTFSKSRSIGSTGTIVQGNDQLGPIVWSADDGTSTLKAAASIDCYVDGTPGANDMPGRLVFSTTADGAASPAERMRITSGGNVGIGTTSPSFNLVSANSTTDGGWLYSSGSVSTLGLGGYSLAGDGAFQLKYDRSTGVITFNGGSRDTPVERVRIDSSGNVGIGTPSDGPKLLVYGNGTTANTLSVVNPSATNGAIIYLGDSNQSSAIKTIPAGGTHSLGFFVAGSNTERLRIDSSGRLLVGTSSAVPVGGYGAEDIQSYFQSGGAAASIAVISTGNNTNASVLHLSKSRGGTSTVVNNGDNIGSIHFSGADGTDLLSIAAIVKCEVDGTPGANDMPGRLVFSTTADGAASPTERMRITSGGNVGIGTSSPSSSLEVAGQINAVAPFAGFAALQTAAGTGFRWVLNNDGTFFLQRTTDGFVTGSISINVDSSNRVGIGTTSPTTLLDVNTDTVRVRTARTPASASATGATGEICWDANYIYVCTATNTWKRSAISTW